VVISVLFVFSGVGVISIVCWCLCLNVFFPLLLVLAENCFSEAGVCSGLIEFGGYLFLVRLLPSSGGEFTEGLLLKVRKRRTDRVLTAVNSRCLLLLLLNWRSSLSCNAEPAGFLFS
jgi:hypothetical protein